MPGSDVPSGASRWIVHSPMSSFGTNSRPTIRLSGIASRAVTTEMAMMAVEWSRAQFTRRVYHCVQPMKEPALFGFLIGLRVRELQEARAEHRRQREAHEHRDEDRERHRPAERVDEPLGIAVHEGDRQEDHDERQRRRHDRQGHLFSALNSRLVRRAVLLLDVAEDVLEDDDRVVDHDPDSERDGEQRHVVQREPHDAHQGERGDDRRRDRQRRDDDRTDVPDEEHHDDRGEQCAEDEVFLERRNRGVDELRVVANDSDFHRRRERPLNVPEGGAYALDHGNRVLSHRPADVEHDRRRFTQPDRRRGPLEAVFRVADIRNPDRRAALGRHDQSC